jgi:hypothetical protein
MNGPSAPTLETDFMSPVQIQSQPKALDLSNSHNGSGQRP